MKTNLFDWALPEWLRKRRAVEPDAQAQRLALIEDTDPVLRTITQELHDQFQEEVLALLSNQLGQPSARGGDRDGRVYVSMSQAPAGAVEYQRGRAAGVFGLLLRLDAQRAAAKAELLERQRKESRRG